MEIFPFLDIKRIDKELVDRPYISTPSTVISLKGFGIRIIFLQERMGSSYSRNKDLLLKDDLG